MYASSSMMILLDESTRNGKRGARILKFEIVKLSIFISPIFFYRHDKYIECYIFDFNSIHSDKNEKRVVFERRNRVRNESDKSNRRIHQSSISKVFPRIPDGNNIDPFCFATPSPSSLLLLFVFWVFFLS